MNCESCETAGIITEATTRSKNSDYSGYDLCEDCAREYDERDAEQKDLRESAYDERGIRN